MSDIAWIALGEEVTKTQNAVFDELTKRVLMDPNAIGQGTLVSCFHTQKRLPSWYKVIL